MRIYEKRTEMASIIEWTWARKNSDWHRKWRKNWIKLVKGIEKVATEMEIRFVWEIVFELAQCKLETFAPWNKVSKLRAIFGKINGNAMVLKPRRSFATASPSHINRILCVRVRQCIRTENCSLRMNFRFEIMLLLAFVRSFVPFIHSLVGWLVWRNDGLYLLVAYPHVCIWTCLWTKRTYVTKSICLNTEYISSRYHKTPTAAGIFRFLYVVFGMRVRSKVCTLYSVQSTCITTSASIQLLWLFRTGWL